MQEILHKSRYLLFGNLLLKISYWNEAEETVKKLHLLNIHTAQGRVLDKKLCKRIIVQAAFINVLQNLIPFVVCLGNVGVNVAGPVPQCLHACNGSFIFFTDRMHRKNTSLRIISFYSIILYQ